MNTVTVEDFSREECVLMMALSTFAELEKKGFISGGWMRLLPEGEITCDKLRTAGFEFNEGELERAVAYLQSAGEQREQENAQ